MAGENQNSQGAAASAGAAGAGGQAQDGKAQGGAGEGSGAGQAHFDVQAEFDRALRGVNESSKRTITEQLEKQLPGLEKKIGDLLEKKIAEIAPSKKQSGGKAAADQDQPDPSIELARMRGQQEETAKQLLETRNKLEAAERKARSTSIRSALQAALGPDCLRPDIVCRLDDVLQKLDLDESGGEPTVKATVTDKYGATEKVDLEKFVASFVKVNFPELFKGTARGGSPASGDNGPGGQIPLEAILDTKTHDASAFIRDYEKNAALLASGRVAMPKRQ